jgi:drug/metabolite transporter (DMT)-like permease
MSTTAYLIPIVAIILGVAFRGETIAPVAFAGVGVVLIGAYSVTRAVMARPDDSAERAETE